PRDLQVQPLGWPHGCLHGVLHECLLGPSPKGGAVEKWRRREDVAFRIVDGECVVVPVRKSAPDLAKLFLLNRVATHVWTQIEEPRSKVDLEASIVERYEVDTGTARTDLETLLVKLEKLDLVQKLT
ncbi:MAG: PqqD family protein, partial [Pseudomonadota bacterium]